MKVILLVCAFCIAISFAQNIFEDDEGNQFYVLPVHSRERRQTKWGVNERGAGISHNGNIFKNDNHRLDGGVSASKVFHGPASGGGNLDYTHIPSGSKLHAGATRTERFGTDLHVQGQANIWRKGNSELSAVGRYDKHFGGVGGTRRSDHFVGAQFNHRF